MEKRFNWHHVDLDDTDSHRTRVMSIGGSTVATALGLHANSADNSELITTIGVNVGPINENYRITEGDVPFLLPAILFAAIAARGVQRHLNNWRFRHAQKLVTTPIGQPPAPTVPAIIREFRQYGSGTSS